jgi:CRP-like cAMP-binding protein
MTRVASPNLVLVPTDCRACSVRTVGMCEPFTADELETIERLRTGTRMFRAGEDLLRQGDRATQIYNLLDGWACSYELLPDGGRQIHYFALPGAMMGFHPDAGAPLTASVQAVTDISVCEFDRQKLIGLARQRPDLALRLTWMIARDELMMFDHLTSLGRRTARQRVAHLLLELLLRARRAMPQAGEEMRLPLTQTHIADALGLTSVHVSRTLTQLRKEKLVDVSDRTMRVLDPVGLAEVAGLDPDIVLGRPARPLESGRRRA